MEKNWDSSNKNWEPRRNHCNKNWFCPAHRGMFELTRSCPTILELYISPICDQQLKQKSVWSTPVDLGVYLIPGEPNLCWWGMAQPFQHFNGSSRPPQIPWSLEVREIPKVSLGPSSSPETVGVSSKPLSRTKTPKKTQTKVMNKWILWIWGWGGSGLRPDVTSVLFLMGLRFSMHMFYAVQWLLADFF